MVFNKLYLITNIYFFRIISSRLIFKELLFPCVLSIFMSERDPCGSKEIGEIERNSLVHYNI